MGKQVLVAYGTKYGSTAEIAEKIGEVLRKEGTKVDVLSAGKVGDVSVYTAIVLGSATYFGFWRKEAAKFLKENVNILSNKKVWLFSSGPMSKGDPYELSMGWTFPDGLKPFAEQIKPRGNVILNGSVNIKKLNFIEKWVIKNVSVKEGDYRDWDSITSWAKSIATNLKND